MPKRFKGINIKKSRHVEYRPQEKGDIGRDGQLVKVHKDQVTFIRNSTGEIIPTEHHSRDGSFGRWHLVSDSEGQPYQTVTGKTARAYLYWTQPFYVILKGSVYHGTRQYFPGAGGGIEGRPVDLSRVEAVVAYCKLWFSAQKAYRDTRKIEDLAERQRQRRWHVFRLRKANQGFAWIEKRWGYRIQNPNKEISNALLPVPPNPNGIHHGVIVSQKEKQGE